jgi:outer membrane protein TolC
MCAAVALLLSHGAFAQEGPPLQEWIAAAQKNNPKRAMSQAGVLTAEADRLRAGAALLPMLRAQASYTYNQYETEIEFTEPGQTQPERFVIAPHNAVQVLLSARVPLIDAAGYARWRGARHAASAVSSEDLANGLDVALEVARYYYDAVSALQVFRAAERAKAVAVENARILKARLQAGATTPLLADRAELEVTRSEQLAIAANRGWLAARRSLASATGMAEPEALSAPPPSTDAAPPEAELLAKAESNRPELAAARSRLEESRRNKTAAWAGYAPTIYATGNERWTNAPGFTGQKSSYDVGVALEWTLLDFGTRSADLKRERAANLRNEAGLQQRLTAVRDEVHSAWLDVEAARAKLVAARRGDEVSQRAAEEMRSRFRAGTTTQLEVIQSDRDALQAVVDRIRAEGDLAVARLALQRAVGEPLVPASPAP